MEAAKTNYVACTKVENLCSWKSAEKKAPNVIYDRILKPLIEKFLTKKKFLCVKSLEIRKKKKNESQMR
jgi:hypothetical protein